MQADINTDVFSPDYVTARQRLLSALEQHHLPVRQESFTHPLSGPNDEPLCLDALWIGKSEAPHLLVTGSACHGVEGFAGSAIQLDNISNLADLPNDMAVLHLHAINPWGFAWLRRTDEQGIDVNRNFIDFKKPLPVNQGYEQLADAIVPESLGHLVLTHANAQLEAYRQQNGQQQLEEAVSGGQYTHPGGLFYGGKSPCWSRQTLTDVYNRFQLDRIKRIIIVDMHTGLGPYGYGEIICDHPPASYGAILARQIFGDSVTEPLLGTSSSVPKQGLMDFFWHEKLGERGCYVTLEFGTYPLDYIFSALRADHWLYQYDHAEPHHDEYHAIKKQLSHYFNPGCKDWREMVLFRGRQVIEQAQRNIYDA